METDSLFECVESYHGGLTEMGQLFWYEVKKIIANHRTKLLLLGVILLNLFTGFLFRPGGSELEWEEEKRAQLSYFEEYKAYWDDFYARAEAMQQISIWKDAASYSNRNIKKTVADFSSLRLDLQPGQEEGINDLGSCFWTDCLMLLFLLFQSCSIWKWEKENRAQLLLQTCKYGTWKLAVVKLLTAILGATVFFVFLYGTNYVLCWKLSGYGGFERSIQSIESFRNCNLSLSVGQYICLLFVTKWIAFLAVMIFLSMLLLVFDGMFFPTCVSLIFFLLEYLLYTRIGEHEALRILRTANIFTFLDTSEVIGNYRNFNVFGYPVNRMTLWADMAGILMSFTGLVPVLFVCKKKQKKRHKQQNSWKYRWNEAVYWKTAARFLKGRLRWELSIGIKKTGASILLVLFLLSLGMLSFEEKTWYWIPAEKASYQNWIHQYAGKMTEEKREEIEGWRTRFDTAGELVVEWEQMYQEGSITADQLKGRKWELERDMERKDGFDVFYAQYQEVGNEYGIVSEAEFAALLNGTRISAVIHIVMMLAIACLSVSMLNREYQRNTVILLRSTGAADSVYRGRTVSLLLFVSLLTFVCCLMKIYLWGFRFGFSDWMLSVRCVPQLTQTVFHGTIGGYLFVLALLQCVGMMAVSVLMLAISVLLCQCMRALLANAIFAMPFVFQFFQIRHGLIEWYCRLLDWNWVLEDSGSLMTQMIATGIVCMTAGIIWWMAGRFFCGTFRRRR